ncbi:MAG: hydrogenase maturation nickel metallochaperone HypA [Lewinellaceae bacterium]|nr:hydrogenase maturation nickel metallochaperone HypA [Lewinellaceae bacterium]
MYRGFNRSSGRRPGRCGTQHSRISLWPAAVGDTPLADTKLRIERLPGRAVCSDCGKAFDISFYYDPCPACGSHFLNITQGEELRIKSITLASTPHNHQIKHFEGVNDFSN